MKRSRTCFPIIVVLGLICPVAVRAGEPASGEILARVGPKVVTARELEQRIDLMPWADKEKAAMQDSVKRRALRSLVAEKLFALEAQDRGIGDDERTLAMTAALERALARDQLYKEEVVRKVRLTDGEIQKGLQRVQWQLRVLGYAFGTEGEAREFAHACAAHADRPDSAIGAFLRASSRITDTLMVSYGDLDRAYEDALYRLDRPGITPPVFSQKLGWAVFRLLDKRSNPLLATQSLPALREAVVKKARTRLGDLRAQQFVLTFSKGMPLHLDSAMFVMLADTVVALLRADSTDRRAGLVNHVDRLRMAFGGRLHLPFARGPQRIWTLEEVLESLRFFPVPFPEGKSARKIVYVLNRLLLEAIESETFSAEGMARAYHRSAEVREDLAQWQDAWRGLADARQVARSILGAEDDEPAGGDSISVARREQRERDRHTLMQKHLQSLARRYGVETFERKLEGVAISPVNMVTRRNIGFGGTMMAVPIIAPEWEWITGPGTTPLMAP